MLDNIIKFSIYNKLIIGLFTLALVCWGIYSLTTLPIDAVPDITNNQVQVITTSPSLAAQEIERSVTFPIEMAMSTIPNTIEVRSISRFGLSVVTIVFKDQTDVYWARQQVSERLDVATEQIPREMGIPTLAPVTTGLGEIYQYVLHTQKGYEKKYDATELRSIQDWIVRRQLLGTQGVADVSSFGGFVKQYEIAIDPEKLRSFNASISDIFEALARNNQNTGGAYIDKKPTALFIRSEGLIANLDDIGKIAVRQNSNGVPVLIRDLADVRMGHATRYGAMTRNDEGEVVGGLVLMLKGANSSDVIGKVKARIDQIRKTLPEGVVIEPFLDRTRLVDNAIGTVATNLIEGALIVIFVLVLLLGNLRAGLVVASVIPLSMLFAVSMMKLFGVSGNLMSLGAIDFGLIVDGAVIIVEATLHHISGKKMVRRLSQEEMDADVYLSASRIRNSAVFGELIILIVYLPLLALIGIEGKMFRPMAQTVAFAILGAFILSLTYVPMISALFLNKQMSSRKTISDRIMAFFQALYTPALEFALHRKGLVLLISTLTFGLSLVLFFQLGGEFIPQLDEGDFAVETRVLPGSSLSETVDAVQKSAGILKKNFPDEIIEVVGKIGSSEIPTDPMPIEAGDMMIILNKKDKWKKAKGREELAQQMQEVLEQSIAGVSFGFQQPIQMRFNELMTGVKQDVAIKIFGEDMDVLSRQAEKVGKIVTSVQGAEDLYVESISGLPQIVVHFDRDAMARFGVSIAEANRAINAGFAGSTAGVVLEGEKRFDLVVRLAEQERKSVENVSNLFVKSLNGTQVPLNQIASVQIKPGVNQIQREDAKRRIIVAFNVRGRDVEGLVDEIRGRIEKQITLPTGYYVTYGGQYQNLIDATERLSVAVPVALLLIGVLLYFTFHSIKQSILILSAIPLSAIGGIFALYVQDLPFSISAGVGFIALFGVAVLNGIVLISEFNFLKNQGLAELRNVILVGTSNRLRPVLMTATVASLGFLPMAISESAGAEVQRPLATVVIGGLISATLLTLFVLPILYWLTETWRPRKVARMIGWFTTGLIISSVAPQRATAQSPETITLESALAEVSRQNLILKSDSYQIEQRRVLQRTAREVSNTEVGWMGGQYNSYVFDNHFSLSQKLPNPVLNRRRADLLAAQMIGSENKFLVTKAALHREIKVLYYEWLLLHQRETILRQQILLSQGFFEAASQRLKAGETNRLETATAQSMLIDLQTTVTSIATEKGNIIHGMEAMLNSSKKILPDTLTPLKRPFIITDTSNIATNPILSYLRQQIVIQSKSKELEKAALLPDVTLGYFNQSLVGTAKASGTEVFGPDKRFQGMLLTVGIPIFRQPLRARIDAAEIQSKIAQNDFEQGTVDLKMQVKQALDSFRQAESNLDKYENISLPLATGLDKDATKSYQIGEINYMEYSQALSRSLGVRITHLDLVDIYNRSVIQLEYLLQNQDNVR